jgi:hypothetical protein
MLERQRRACESTSADPWALHRPLKVVFDVFFGLLVIRRIVGRHFDLSAFALGCNGHSFLAGFLPAGSILYTSRSRS